MVSLITDADHSTCTVAVATAEPRAGLADVHMVHAPALPLSSPFLLNPAELGGPATNQTKTPQITNLLRLSFCMEQERTTMKL